MGKEAIMTDTAPIEALITKTTAAVLLEGLLDYALPGTGVISLVREDILKMFEQRLGSIMSDTPEHLATLDVLLAIKQERFEQRAGKYNNEHDDTHIDGELGRFAAQMIIPEELYRMVDPKTCHLRTVLPMEEVPEGDGDGGKEFRPWTLPKAKDKDRLDLLIKAAAVLVAEIERLKRVREVERCAEQARKLAAMPAKKRTKRKKR